MTQPATVGRKSLGIAVARLRFPLLIAAFLAIVAAWPTLKNWWDKWTQSGSTRAPISSEIEYWCPMCPGVVSDWPSKCPVCSMSLIRRKKGDMTPLPDGSLARVQLSPYRIQLAGIRTAPVEYRGLEREVVVTGLLEAQPGGLAGSERFSRLLLVGEALERESILLKAGDRLAVASDARPGAPFTGRILTVVPLGNGGGQSVRLEVDNPDRTLRPGDLCLARRKFPLTEIETYRNWHRQRQQQRLWMSSLSDSLFENAIDEVHFQRGQFLALPADAVVDTGEHTVVFVETMPGVYDAREVLLGPRCGEFHPVLAGLEHGERIVSHGSLLLDAESRLNPSLAASYFGAGSRPGGTARPGGSSKPGSLSPEEKLLADKQKICPVTGASLYSMGGPVRVGISGRTVFICCEGCEEPLRDRPSHFLNKLPK